MSAMSYGEIVEGPTKEDIFKKMVKHVCLAYGECDSQDFNEVYALLKQEDDRLDEQGFTDCHFSRYTIVKLLKLAEAYV